MSTAVRILAAFALSIGASALPALADSAVMTRSGVVYEVFPARYGDLVPSAAGTADARLPVLALRTTRPGAAPLLDLVDGTVTSDEKGSPSVAYDEATDTLFVVYMRFSGLMTDVHFAARRNGGWIERNILPSPGLYLSLNPQLVLTRQSYVDVDGAGQPVSKTRSVVSVVWWEEGGRSQARYAPVFVEDGVLHLDEITAYNLNELAGEAGPTSIEGLPFSSYQHPAVQRDPTQNGGVLVSFANLAAQRQNVLRIGFPDDLSQLLASGVPLSQANVRIHTPIGRGGSSSPVPMINASAPVGTVIAPESLVPTFFWTEDGVLRVLPSSAPADAPATSIVLRPDFSLDRAISVVREMALSN